jgi:hypothetical protein
MTDIVAGPLGGMRTLDIAVKTPGIESLMTVSFAVTGRVLERGAIQLIFADEYEMSPNPTVRIEPAARPPLPPPSHGYFQWKHFHSSGSCTLM